MDISPAFIKEDSQFIRESHRTLLILRRKPKGKSHLKLQHQRTCDVCFDWYLVDHDGDQEAAEAAASNQLQDPVSYVPNSYIYHMIETMLPSAAIDAESKEFKLLEM